MKRELSKLTLIGVIALTAVAVIAQQQAPAPLEPSVAKLKQHISYLASDALDGRRTGTSGSTDAARYIAGEFARVGLRPALQKAGAAKPSVAMTQYLQSFPYVAGVELGKNNNFNEFNAIDLVALQPGPPPRRNGPGQNWMPLGFSSNGDVRSELAFVGFGITASELNHNDYAGDVARNRVALVLQGTPDGENPHGQFARFEGVRWKAVAAKNAGAKALIVISKEEKLEDDRLGKLTYDNSGGEAGIPVIVISRQTADRLLKGANTSLSELEKDVAAKTTGTNRVLMGRDLNSPSERARVVNITTDIVRKESPAYNVIGILEGSDPTLKNETIIIGAHYDHLGRGGEGSLAPSSGEIHHGADDNASGTAGVIELARVLSSQRPRPKRTIMFMAFSGEEEGLLGSNYYVNNPIRPLANTVAMINMDMIGRMKNSKLVIGGMGTAKEWRDLVNLANRVGEKPSTDQKMAQGGPVRVNEIARRPLNAPPARENMFELTLNEDGFGPSDHSSFYAKQIPVLFFWTGTHADYHKPSDTFDKINYEDEAQILRMVWQIVKDLDAAPSRPTYTTAKSDTQPRSGGFRVYLGTIPNYADSNDGLLIDGVRDDSPAAKAGIKAGDRIVKIGTSEIKNINDYTYALGEMKAGEEYSVELIRAGEKVTLKIKPEARK